MKVALHLAVDSLAYLDLVVSKFLYKVFHTALLVRPRPHFCGNKLSQIMSILAPNYRTTEKMTRGGLICMLIILVFSSGCDRDKIPPGVLDKQEYAEYLVSVYVAEAKLNTYAITPDSAMKLFQPYERSLQQKFGKSDSVIKKTFEWYLAHPQDLEQVYTAVIDTLNLLEQKASVRPAQPQ
jgi:hypothetical protein